MNRQTNYMDDPRMADLANEPLPVREVHAWRLQVQDEKQGMSGDQLAAYYKASRERTQSYCAEHGIHINYAPNPFITVQAKYFSVRD